MPHRLADPPDAPPDRRTLAAVVLAALFGIVLIRTAWMGDDAYITFRTVDNFVSGYGMRWNVAERVQSFTHPLWFLVFSAAYFVTREAYFTAYALTIGLSIVAYVLVLRRIASSVTIAIVAGAALILSKAFMDYSTSGLENPLSHLVTVLLLLSLWRVQESGVGLWRAWLFGAILALNRLDLALIAGPPLVAVSWRYPWRRVVRSAAAGLTPLVAWHVFSLVYYGVLFPNTAYAKLQTGVSSSVLVQQGLLYLLDAVGTDPVTPLVIVSAAVLLFLMRARRDWALLAGILLYVLYIVGIGGDFMTGRFLSVPLLAAVAVLARQPWTLSPGGAQAALASLTVLGLLATTRPPITSGARTFIMNPYDGLGTAGVADERVFYYRYTGLLRWSRERPLPWNAQVERGMELRKAPAVVQETNVGFIGYYAGPDVTIVDQYGLCDPLLARLPAQGDWRIGHFLRTPPDGYIESLRKNQNLLVDPDLALQYEQIRRVTRGPLWSARRWRAILALNLPRRAG